MISSSDLNTMDLLDDVDHLLFLCDRLSNRLRQVTSYVDQIKQTWVDRRKSVESATHKSPVDAQKASKCYKILLNVAEKLAAVELQTESLHALQSPAPTNLASLIEPPEEHSPAQQCIGKDSPATTFTPRNTATLFSETRSFKQPSDRLQSKEDSIFPQSPSDANGAGPNQQKFSSQALVTSLASRFLSVQKTAQNGLTNGPSKQSSNVIIPRLPSLADPYAARTSNESSVTNGKVRVKMQMIKTGTVWGSADIPIIDHPSAFFVCNQDPRIAEQFHLMAVEMNTHYNKPSNTITPLQNPAIGDFCVARFSEDHHWYRARVVLIHSNDSILIVFIDYGNSETKPANEVYPMQESLSRLPAMTVACTLAESFPRNDNFWTTEATEIFSQLVKNRIVEVHFQQSSGQQWPLHFVKVMLDGQSVVQHPQLSPHVTSVRNEQIAMHFNDKLTSMEYILYNVAVVESDIHQGSLP